MISPLKERCSSCSDRYINILFQRDFSTCVAFSLSDDSLFEQLCDFHAWDRKPHPKYAYKIVLYFNDCDKNAGSVIFIQYQRILAAVIITLTLLLH